MEKIWENCEENMEKIVQKNLANPAFQMIDALKDVHINEPAVNKNVRQICYLASTLSGDNKLAWLLKAINFIDLTTLSGDDTSSNVEYLCQKAAQPLTTLPFEWEKPLHTAAVCVYPSRVKDAVTALKELKMDVIKVASVAGGFPSGQYPLESRLQEVRYAIECGAQEIDVVIDRSLVLTHNWLTLYHELAEIRAVCNEKKTVCLKVILSIGELYNLKDIYKTSMVAMFAGANFIKTSTGKEAVNATLPAGVTMCRAIKEYERLTSTKVGFKPAGGIKTAQEALEWMVLVKEELGKDWLTNTHFRIGASSLVDNIATEIVKVYVQSDMPAIFCENRAIGKPVAYSKSEQKKSGESSSGEKIKPKTEEKAKSKTEEKNKSKSEEKTKSKREERLSKSEEKKKSKSEEKTELKNKEKTDPKREERQSQSEEKTDSKREERQSQSEEKTDSKKEERQSKNEENTDPKSEEKTDHKSEEKIDPKSEEKTDRKSEEKTDRKSEEKTDHKSEEKTEPKSEEETDPKSEEKTDPKSEKKKRD